MHELERIKTKNVKNGIKFLFNAELSNDDKKLRLVKKHAENIAKLVDKYSDPKITDALGRHLEGLVKAELRAQGFKIRGIHTNKYKGRKWTESDHDLDFIAEHSSSKLTIGVEVKNTIDIME